MAEARPMTTNAPDAIPAEEWAETAYNIARGIPSRVRVENRTFIANVIARAIANAVDADRASRAPLAAPVAEGWRDIASAPKDGTHILAKLHRAACEDMDGIRQAAFTEIREIWYRPYTNFGMSLPWHAGDPFDSHEAIAPEHMGEAVPTEWMPLPAAPGTHPAPASPDAEMVRELSNCRHFVASMRASGVNNCTPLLYRIDALLSKHGGNDAQ